MTGMAETSPAVVYLVGGDSRSTAGFPPHVAMRHFGSTQFGGNGCLKRVLDGLRTGRVDLVVLLTRWIGHSAAREVRDACSVRGIRLLVVPGGRSSAIREVMKHLAGDRGDRCRVT